MTGNLDALRYRGTEILGSRYSGEDRKIMVSSASFWSMPCFKHADGNLFEYLIQPLLPITKLLFAHETR